MSQSNSLAPGALTSPAAVAAARPGIDAGDDLGAFAGVDAWIFDLDNTLYPRNSEVFGQIEQRIRIFVQRLLNSTEEEADRVQHEYYVRYGATLRGLMVEHGIAPDEFLAFVHDIDHSALSPDPLLVDAVTRLPGRRFILTNGSRRHAERVAESVGLAGMFEDIFDIAWAEHLPKPAPAVYERVVARTGIDAARAAMFEDLAKNLVTPKALGMRTVLVLPPGTRDVFKAEWDLEAGRRPVIDFMTEDLGSFLQHVLAGTT